MSRQTVHKVLHLQVFDSKHDPLFIAVSLAIAAFACVIAYTFSLRYSADRSQAFFTNDSQITNSLILHQNAFTALQSAEASVAALKENNISDQNVEERLARIRNLFASGKYDEMQNLKLDLDADSKRLLEEDERLYSSYSAALINLQIKFEDYKKQGVSVASVAGEIATASGYLQDKKYPEVEKSVLQTNSLLDKLLALKKEADKKAAASVSAAPIAAQSSGGVTYERKVVNTSRGGFTADILTADMNRVKVKTFTGNENDCSADCPLKPLQSYVAENGGIAGINGTYFCPADYAQCAGTKNSFNFLVFDYRTKKYLNSDQNKFSVNPLISFYNDGAHYYTEALGFGRDTSANGVISNYPTLVHNGGVAASDGGTKGIRCGVGFRDKSLWAVCARSATVGDLGYVFQSLGAMYALNLDGGGSAALYFNGYKVGPGRQLPNAIVFTN